MKYIIYHRETTFYMFGMKKGGYATKGAATAALNRAAKKTAADLEMARYFDDTYITLEGDYAAAIKAARDKFGTYNIPTNTHLAERDLINPDDYAIAEAKDFFDNIEKMVTRKNLMSGKEYEERANTPHYLSPASETYWSM